MQKPQLIKLGKIVNTHGIKGELVVRLYNQDDSILDDGVEICLIDPATEQTQQKIAIEQIRFGNKVLVRFPGITSIELAEKLVNFEIAVKRDQLPECAEGEYYLADLIGLEVFDFDSGKKIGVVAKVTSTYQDIITILAEDGIDSWDVPLKSGLVREVNVQEKKIVIHRPVYI